MRVYGLLLIVLGLSVSPVLGFDSAVVERQIEVEVVDDEDAFVAVRSYGPGPTGSGKFEAVKMDKVGHERKALQLTNNLETVVEAQILDVSVDWLDAGREIRPVASGKSVHVRLEVTSEPPEGCHPVRVTVRAESDAGTTAYFERTVWVEVGKKQC